MTLLRGHVGRVHSSRAWLKLLNRSLWYPMMWQAIYSRPIAREVKVIHQTNHSRVNIHRYRSTSVDIVHSFMHFVI